MSASEVRPNPGEVRAWAKKNGIRVSGTGNISRHLRESYLEANPDVELQARNARPDLFALADDMVEAEMVRTGRLSFEASVAAPTTVEPPREEPRSLAEWLRLRDELAATIAEHAPQGVSDSFREAAEALLVKGWMRSAAA
ncbi:Lsr2 family protein [Microbacterium sp. 3J1]|uniref:Lsr2 family DNA-binding protein n=1 Tax=Microbacterium sp. 3J1 TaxID=861269 RepID=UPI000B2FAD73|nr:Lsr2 family protein [Microbacterium sp. 3J1]